MSSFRFLIVGGIAATGAALALGTLAAMLRYRRTGRFPGTDEEHPPQDVTTGMKVGLWLRVAVGVALTVWGVISLANADLL